MTFQNDKLDLMWPKTLSIQFTALTGNSLSLKSQLATETEITDVLTVAPVKKHDFHGDFIF